MLVHCPLGTGLDPKWKTALSAWGLNCDGGWEEEVIPLFLLSRLEAEFRAQYSLSHWTMSNMKARAMSQFF